MKREINALDYANEIVAAFGNGGILLTTKNADKVNAMTIGWGGIGRFWNEPYFIVFVRSGRFSSSQIDASGEFTLNIPYGQFDRRILGYCGSRTGRNIDKLGDLGLTLVESDTVAAPGIKELPLTIECKVLYRQVQDKAGIPEDILKEFYPEDKDSTQVMANRDPHVVYYGKIMKAYIIE